MTTLKGATAQELLKEFMTRGCVERRRAVRDECSADDAEVVMEIFGLDETETSGYSSEDLDEAEESGRKRGIEEERERLLGLMGELAFCALPETQARVRDYLFREHGITNVYAARML